METWRIAVGHPRYEVSSLGRIRCGRELLRGWNTNGYRKVRLDGKVVTVHSVVAAAFLGPREGRIINHKDGVKAHNADSNLEYCTTHYNAWHSIHVLGNPLPPKGPKHNSKTSPGTFPRGKLHGNAKLSETDVFSIRLLYAFQTASQPVLAAKFGVSQKVIWQVVNRKTWKHV